MVRPQFSLGWLCMALTICAVGLGVAALSLKLESHHFRMFHELAAVLAGLFVAPLLGAGLGFGIGALLNRQGAGAALSFTLGACLNFPVAFWFAGVFLEFLFLSGN